MSDQKGEPTKLGDILAKYKTDDSAKYISQEFQNYGYRLAVDLDDLEHKALYIRLAKTMPRKILEQARSFAVDATFAKSRARLFMWKMKEIRSTVKE